MLPRLFDSFVEPFLSHRRRKPQLALCRQLLQTPAQELLPQPQDYRELYQTLTGRSLKAMPALYDAGSNVAALYLAVFVVYWCYGTQLSVNGVAAADFWGTRNAGINYGLLFTAWGVAGIIGPRIGGVLYDKYHDYKAAFYTAAALAALALLCELSAKRPARAPDQAAR